MTTELKYTYNTFGLPIKLTYTDVNGNIRTVREETSLTYDKNGNILTENTTEAYSGSVTKTKQYAYDLGNRLISATMGGTTTTYGYDLVGNRTSRKKGSEAQENYTYNYLNQLTQVQQGSTSTSYSYDDRGNQIQEVYTVSGQSATTIYSYDLANRMTSLNRTSGNVTLLNSSFGYNALNQRVTRVENEVITHFYYTGGALLFSTENEYLLKTQNILDPSGGIVASKRFEGQEQMGQDPFANEYFFYRYDVRGSVTSIVDGTGTRIKGYDYDEFGNATASNNTFYNEVTFTGSISDASGLQYMNARYYNPKTARFLSQDTYTGVASTPWTQHLYSYCNNNPVNMVDPTGHRPSFLVNLSDGSGRKISDDVVPDTDSEKANNETEEPDNPQIYELIKSNINKAKTVRWLAIGSAFLGTNRHAISRYAGEKALKYLWFFVNVKDKGPMDYKEQETWTEALPSLSYPADSGEKATYPFNGKLISASDLGNINYGAVGAALGIPLEILLWQGGAAQLRKSKEDGGEGYNPLSSEIESFRRRSSGFCGDQEDDYEYIKTGYYLYYGGYFG